MKQTRQKASDVQDSSLNGLTRLPFFCSTLLLPSWWGHTYIYREREKKKTKSLDQAKKLTWWKWILLNLQLELINCKQVFILFFSQTLNLFPAISDRLIALNSKSATFQLSSCFHRIFFEHEAEADDDDHNDDGKSQTRKMDSSNWKV